MYLHQLLLSNADITHLAAIYADIASNRDNLKFIREQLYKFIAVEADDCEITPVQMTRLLRQTASSPSYLQHLLFDFSEKYLFPSLSSDGWRLPVSPETQQRILDLHLSRQKRLRVSQIPNEVVSLNNMWSFIQHIPDVFINEFIGYRRSTTGGSIIKYYLAITKTKRPFEVRFENIYIYDGVMTFVEGFGFFVNGTLYLMGHAIQRQKKSDDEKEKYIETHPSAGMRVLALHCVPGTDHLAGLVLTASRETPIAARVLMIPARYHRSWSADKRDTDNDNYKKSEMIIRRLGDMEANETIMMDLLKTPLIETEEQLDIMIDNITVSLLSCRRTKDFEVTLESNMTKLRNIVEIAYNEYVAEHNCRDKCKQQNKDCRFPDAPAALRNLLSTIIGEYVRDNGPSIDIKEYLTCQSEGNSPPCRMSDFL